MLADHQLQRVPASREHADRLIAQARDHLRSAAEICDTDPSGGYALVYDAARKALTAVIENQGIRPTTRGGHLAAYEAVRAHAVPGAADPLEIGAGQVPGVLMPDSATSRAAGSAYADYYR
jgi:hypothetical protein